MIYEREEALRNIEQLVVIKNKKDIIIYKNLKSNLTSVYRTLERSELWMFQQDQNPHEFEEILACLRSIYEEFSTENKEQKK